MLQLQLLVVMVMVCLLLQDVRLVMMSLFERWISMGVADPILLYSFPTFSLVPKLPMRWIRLP